MYDMARNQVKGVPFPVPFFRDSCIHKAGWSTDTPWWFECSMVSTCSPLFDDCDSNYEVEEKLERAGVLTRGCVMDTESCALVVNFKRKETALAFLKRLNAYLVDKACMVAKARAY